MNVAPRYGTNDDLEDLFQKAAAKGIRIVLDLVAGHTSIEHPWFVGRSDLIQLRFRIKNLLTSLLRHLIHFTTRNKVLRPV